MIVYLSLEEFAARAGKSFSALRSYQAKDMKRGEWHLLPPPDAVTGESGERPRYGWLPETCDTWKRIGQGVRTDLKPSQP